MKRTFWAPVRQQSQRSAWRPQPYDCFRFVYFLRRSIGYGFIYENISSYERNTFLMNRTIGSQCCGGGFDAADEGETVERCVAPIMPEGFFTHQPVLNYEISKISYEVSKLHRLIPWTPRQPRETSRSLSLPSPWTEPPLLTEQPSPPPSVSKL